MIVQTEVQESATVATILVKEANLMVSDQFKQEVTLLLDGGQKYLVVSFENVIYVDSSFLGALVAALKHAIAHKADVVLANLNKDVLGLFQLIRLDKAFKIYPSVNDALAAQAK
ncbi:anti-sigma factor antagonist [Mucilaginibacter terrenus]|uniref:Anti-sigma factor antagonist n=1 Tax=Mucilaginibacter terrenus TaxID=2482727 RepID=A0A3E2NVL2_9SPHI|nr:STAS domain-containing protein [Mucilaginibacter terrenus]RFZ84997.1 anti-sigma factor antagonist [Mucilaginibacter terrenus]